MGSILLIVIGMLIAWFLVPVPDFVVKAKDLLIKKIKDL